MHHGEGRAKWYGSIGQLCRDFFTLPFDRSSAFELGREYRRRFDARHELPEHFALAVLTTQVPLSAMAPRPATWREMTGSWRLKGTGTASHALPVFFLLPGSCEGRSDVLLHERPEGTVHAALGPVFDLD